MTGEPSFGERIAGASYRERPGSYAVLVDGRGRVAVVRTPSGTHLPGGGADPGETPEETLVREVREECGLTVSSARWLGRATQNLYAPGEGHFAKRCAYFIVLVRDGAPQSSEPDHELAWIPFDEAIAELSAESHRWALRRARKAGWDVPRAG